MSIDSAKAGKELNDQMLLHWPFVSVDIEYNHMEDATGGKVMAYINPMVSRNMERRHFSDGFSASLFLHNLCMNNNKLGKYGGVKVANIKVELVGGYIFSTVIQISPHTVQHIFKPKYTLSLVMFAPMHERIKRELQMGKSLPEMFYLKKVETIIQHGSLHGIDMTKLPPDLLQRMKDQLLRYCRVFMSEFPKMQTRFLVQKITLLLYQK